MNTLLYLAALFALTLATASTGHAAPACQVPATGNWTVDADCDVTANEIAPRNVAVLDDATLRITDSGSLNVDMNQFRVQIASSGRLLVDDGGRLYSFPVGPLMRSSTDGAFGYYLKRVNGAVLQAINPTFPFYAASTIKVLQNLHAMRQVDLGNVTLNGTVLTVCPVSSPNCSDNANTAANCGGSTVTMTLSQAVASMMVVSGNETTNAIQQLFGNGTPSAGRAAINQTGQDVVGMSSATALQHKLACGNVNNDPFNTLTLADIGLLYEQAATNPAVLFPATLPASVQLPSTSFYQLMLNDTNNRFIDPVINTEAASIGMSVMDREAFRGLVRMAHKAGNIGTSYQSIAGWISLPVDGGANTRDYVYGLFVDNASTNTLPGTPSSNATANVLLRGAIRDAIEAW